MAPTINETWGMDKLVRTSNAHHSMLPVSKTIALAVYTVLRRKLTLVMESFHPRVFLLAIRYFLLIKYFFYAQGIQPA